GRSSKRAHDPNDFSGAGGMVGKIDSSAREHKRAEIRSSEIRSSGVRSSGVQESGVARASAKHRIGSSGTSQSIQAAYPDFIARPQALSPELLQLLTPELLISALLCSRALESIFPTMPPAPEKSLGSWALLLLLPFVALLWVPFYNSIEPTLLGFPFFYW